MALLADSASTGSSAFLLFFFESIAFDVLDVLDRLLWLRKVSVFEIDVETEFVFGLFFLNDRRFSIILADERNFL